MNREIAHLREHKPKQYQYGTSKNIKTARNRVDMAGSGVIDVEKTLEIIMIKANENHKEIKTIRRKLINLEDRGYWCPWSGKLSKWNKCIKKYRKRSSL